jgi:MSHA biogenesis protein MshL
MTRDTDIEVGGDMLASGVEDAGVSGKYQVKVKRTGKSTDVWAGVEKTLEGLKSEEGIVRINRTTGTIYMADSPRRIASMVRFLDSLSESLHRQVFIEAKILEVSLSEAYKYGIDWSKLEVEFESELGALPDIFGISFNRGGSIVLSNQSRLSMILDFLRTQGDVIVLSNPHLSVMNGQSAIMTVGYQFPYGDISGVDRDPETGVITFETTIKRAILGLQLGITPQISSDGIVTLHIVPTITRIQREEQVDIPTTATSTQSISNPVIDLQELANTVRVREGQTVVLGGLISQIKRLNHEGLPLLSRIPLLGYLFKHMEKVKENKELVIFITPYIKQVF